MLAEPMYGLEIFPSGTAEDRGALLYIETGFRPSANAERKRGF
jgi:hypothetical protein